MIHFAALAFSIAVAMGIFTWLCLSGSRWRVLATTTFGFLTLGSFAAVIESAGQPKPLLLEWRDVSDAEVVGMSWNEAEHVVWLWLMRDGAPIAYTLPWPKDQQKFGQLQDKWRRRGSSGDEFQYTADGEIAQVRPPKQMPAKTE